MQSKLRNILASMHLLIIVLWLGANSLFIHHHTINGIEIIHSHPYAGDATNHCHTTDAIAHISRMAGSDMLGGEELAYYDQSVGFELYDYAEFKSDTLGSNVEFTSPRGPPSLA